MMLDKQNELQNSQSGNENKIIGLGSSDQNFRSENLLSAQSEESSFINIHSENDLFQYESNTLKDCKDKNGSEAYSKSYFAQKQGSGQVNQVHSYSFLQPLLSFNDPLKFVDTKEITKKMQFLLDSLELLSSYEVEKVKEILKSIRKKSIHYPPNSRKLLEHKIFGLIQRTDILQENSDISKEEQDPENRTFNQLIEMIQSIRQIQKKNDQKPEEKVELLKKKTSLSKEISTSIHYKALVDLFASRQPWRYRQRFRSDLSMDINCLCCTKFFYLQQNIYHPEVTKTPFKLIGPFSEIQSNQAKKSICQQISGMLNAEGGVLLFDVFQNLINVQAQGQFMTEEEKEKAVSYLNNLASTNIPELKIGQQLQVNFVPIVIRNPSQAYRVGNQIEAQQKLCFVPGLFVLRIIVKPKRENFGYSVECNQQGRSLDAKAFQFEEHQSSQCHQPYEGVPVIAKQLGPQEGSQRIKYNINKQTRILKVKGKQNEQILIIRFYNDFGCHYVFHPYEHQQDFLAQGRLMTNTPFNQNLLVERQNQSDEIPISNQSSSYLPSEKLQQSVEQPCSQSQSSITLSSVQIQEYSLSQGVSTTCNKKHKNSEYQQLVIHEQSQSQSSMQLQQILKDARQTYGKNEEQYRKINSGQI